MTKAVERVLQALDLVDYDLDDVMDKITGAGDAQGCYWLYVTVPQGQLNQNRLSGHVYIGLVDTNVAIEIIL